MIKIDINALRALIETADRRAIRFMFQSVYFDVKNKAAVSSNGFILLKSEFEVEEEMSNFSIHCTDFGTIPASATFATIDRTAITFYNKLDKQISSTILNRVNLEPIFYDYNCVLKENNTNTARNNFSINLGALIKIQSKLNKINSSPLFEFVSETQIRITYSKNLLLTIMLCRA